MTSPLNFPLCPLTQLTVTESYDLLSGGGNGSYNSPSSLLSSCTQKQSFMQRSASSHSLQNNGLYFHFASSLNEFINSDSGPVRRAFSTGDLDQGCQSGLRRSESPLSNESNANAIIEGMSRAHRYSPEEKKERIDRYRSKRNLRNFTKKIKYTCRKTLADSRPRIRGRFARNEDIEKNVPQVEWGHHVRGEEDHEEDENWTYFLDSLAANLIIP
ncbi:zinc finger protein CONSTANS-LIKE 1-like [Hibiscus syriacus]|nr:zinc finger protein CONSTANS-LIKE 1-like [Hibiscus syriacus]